MISITVPKTTWLQHKHLHPRVADWLGLGKNNTLLGLEIYHGLGSNQFFTFVTPLQMYLYYLSIYVRYWMLLYYVRKLKLPTVTFGFTADSNSE